MKNNLLKKMFFAAIMLTSSVIFAQTVSGTISDTSGPLPGANVVVQGTTNGVTADFDGNYTLDNVPSDAVLIVSYLGYLTQEIPVDGRSTIDVALIEDATALDEVVIVGYGTQSRANVTGAISTVDSDEITAVPVTNAEQALQGRAAGVTIVNNGSPGTAPTVRIRGLGTLGNNDPLYVIDGVITGSLGNLNASDIESMTVLKDASTTAIYGSQGSNGVIMVTTKKGRSGALQVSLDSYIGSQFTNERYDVLNSDQYKDYINEAFGFVPTSPLSSLNNETDWQDEIFQSGLMQNYDLSVSGGTENSSFRISGGYQDQEGIIVETGFKRYSFRANSSFDLGKVTIGESFSVSASDRAPEIVSGGRSLIEHAIKMAPYLPVYNSDNLGGFQGPSSPMDGQDAENPVRAQTLGNRSNKTVSIVGSAYADWEIIEGLNFKTQLGVDYYTYNNNSFTPSYNDDSTGSNTGSSSFANIVKNSGSGNTTLFTNSLNYKKTFADVHNLEALVLMEWFNNEVNFTNASSQNPISDEVDQVSLEGASLISNTQVIKKIGYLGRVNYNFDERYIVALSIRRDASSKFGDNNRWGTFPSVALGWHISNEGFMADVDFVSDLKLRGSYGLVGNDKINNYLYSSSLSSNFFYPINNSAAVGTTASGLANPNLKWEETTMTNIGIDAGFLNGGVTASLEYYSNTSDDLLIPSPLPTSLGIGNPYTANVGSVETKGFELTAGYNDFDGDFTWSANLNLGTSKNEVKALNGNDIPGGAFEGNNISNISVGEPLFYFYGLEMNGIYQNQAEVNAVFTADPSQTTVQPGDIRYIDHNGDGMINSADRVNIGNPHASVTYGLNLNANFKNWDFNLFLTGVAGNEVYNTNIYDLEGMPRVFNAGTAVLDRWTPTNPSNSVPRAGGAPQNTAISSRFVESGAFTRLRNVTVGYNLNDLIKTETISNFRVYLSGQNLVTFTKYSGLDPEVGQFTGGQTDSGIDRGNYPVAKSVLLGVQLQF